MTCFLVSGSGLWVTPDVSQWGEHCNGQSKIWLRCWHQLWRRVMWDTCKTGPVHRLEGACMLDPRPHTRASWQVSISVTVQGIHQCMASLKPISPCTVLISTSSSSSALASLLTLLLMLSLQCAHFCTSTIKQQCHPIFYNLEINFLDIAGEGHCMTTFLLPQQ